jgi:hypothetical protein
MKNYTENHVQAYLIDIVDLVLEYHNKANLQIM